MRINDSIDLVVKKRTFCGKDRYQVYDRDDRYICGSWDYDITEALCYYFELLSEWFSEPNARYPYVSIHSSASTETR